MPDPNLVAAVAVLALAAAGVTVALTRPRRAIISADFVPSASGMDPEQLLSAQGRIDAMLDDARRDAERVVKDAELRTRDEAVRRREELNRELDAARDQVRDAERRAQRREDAAEARVNDLARRDGEQARERDKLRAGQDKLEARRAEVEAKYAEAGTELLNLSGLSREEAEARVIARVEQELSTEVAARIRRHAERVKADAETLAREVIATAVQRYAAPHALDSTVSTVDIPDDAMKGRIIGREGRNVRTFTQLTGVEVIVDDTPGVVIVSTFDNVRREIARLALTKLIQDGRIHPTRIEEVVIETQAEMERHIAEIGKQAVLDADVAMPHEKIVQLLGRLRFRTSYSQNVLQHSLEVAHLTGMMASELGLNAALARRCGLLHDVGKAADHDMEGGHPKVGAELAKRYGETSPEVLHAIAGHHDDITVDHLYTVLVAAADAISASRPGARRDTLEKYVKRMADLEAIACGFPEVDAAFAVQAGRELRVIANADRASDSDATRICREIARTIEKELRYPGEIKVTVVREKRETEIAR